MHKLHCPLHEYACNLTIEDRKGVSYIMDPVRKYHIVLTPEEMVRQSLIQFVFKEFPLYKSKIAVEKELKINLRKKRFDMLVYDIDFKPYMLIECKAPSIKISQSTMDQVAWYNVALRAPYLLVTNGETTYCASIDFDAKEYTFLSKFPFLSVVDSKQ